MKKNSKASTKTSKAKRRRSPAPSPVECEIEEVIPDLLIPLPEPQGPEPEADSGHPVVRVDLRIAPTLFAKLRELSAEQRTALNVRIVDFIEESVETLRLP